VETALVLNPSLTETQLLRAMLNDFGLEVRGRDRLAYIEKLNAFLAGQSGKDTFRGAPRREHGEAEAERLLKECLKALNMTEDELCGMKNTQPEKQAVAWILKTKTTVTGVWLAERLSMGHRVNASKAISRFRNSKDRKVEGMRRKLLQSTE
jgi:hypothetical protein